MWRTRTINRKRFFGTKAHFLAKNLYISQKNATFTAKISEKSPKNSVIMVFNRNLYLQKLISADGNRMIISGDYGGKFYSNEGVLRIGVFDFLFNTNCLDE